MGTDSYYYLADGSVDHVVYDYSHSGLTAAQEVDYTYTPEGLLLTTTWKNGASTVAVWTFGYDLGGRLASVTHQPTGGSSEEAFYTYDGEGKLKTESNANGTSLTMSYYEPRGLPTGIALMHIERRGNHAKLYAQV